MSFCVVSVYVISGVNPPIFLNTSPMKNAPLSLHFHSSHTHSKHNTRMTSGLLLQVSPPNRSEPVPLSQSPHQYVRWSSRLEFAGGRAVVLVLNLDPGPLLGGGRAPRGTLLRLTVRRVRPVVLPGTEEGGSGSSGAHGERSASSPAKHSGGGVRP